MKCMHMVHLLSHNVIVCGLLTSRICYVRIFLHHYRFCIYISWYVLVIIFVINL